MRDSVGWLTTWLAQVAPGSGAGGNQPAAPAQEDSFNIWSCFLPAVVGLVLMYFMTAGKSRQGDAQKVREALANLKKNDRVITAGGIYGIVVQASADSDYVTIRIDESNNTRIKLLKTSIARVVTDDNAEKEKEA